LVQGLSAAQGGARGRPRQRWPDERIRAQEPAAPEARDRRSPHRGQGTAAPPGTEV